MDWITDRGVLRDTPFKLRSTPSLANKLNSNPAISELRCKFRRPRSSPSPNLRYDSEKIDVARWDSNKTTNLADSIPLPVYKQQPTSITLLSIVLRLRRFLPTVGFHEME
jgi:hypothetical protein